MVKDEYLRNDGGQDARDVGMSDICPQRSSSHVTIDSSCPYMI